MWRIQIKRQKNERSLCLRDFSRGGKLVQSELSDFVSCKLWVARVLRDFPELRSVKKRKELVKKVWELSGIEISPETITRSARYFQNKQGMYVCEGEEETKEELQEKYKEAFN
jgi:hypothetical protein